jgi:hypothetical protein
MGTIRTPIGRKGLHRYFSLLILTTVLSGCASIDPGAMIPDSQTGRVPSVPTNLQVGVVTGAEPFSFLRGSELTNEQLREALAASVKKAQQPQAQQLSKTATGQQELRAVILGQRAVAANKIGEYRRELVVAYELYDLASKSVVWRETYQTEFSGLSFVGAKRFIQSVEGSARENIRSMLEGLEAYFSGK